MLNKGHHITPTFLEGTSGLYQRKESPPNVPGTAPSPFKQPSVFNNNNHSVFNTQYYKHQSNPGSSTQLHSVNFNLQKQPYATQSAYFEGQAPRASASSTSLPMSVSNMVAPTINAYIPQYAQNQQQPISPQRRLSHTPHGNRVAPRSELSSHSFSSPRQLQLTSSISQIVSQPGQQFQVNQQRYSVSSIPSIQHQSTTPQRSGSELPRRVLTSSLSIGNVVQHEHPFYASSVEPLPSIPSSKYQQQRSSMHSDNIRAASISAQSLSAIQQNYNILRKHDSASPGLCESNISPPELPLPPNWEIDITPDGYRYYIDHRNKRTSWVHPLAPEDLPFGWTKIYDQLHGIVYYNEIERRSQFEHPGLNLHSSTTSSIASKKPHHQHQSSASKHQQQSNALADRIRQSASIQSIIQHQKQHQFGGTQRQTTQPLQFYQSTNPYYPTQVGPLNIISEDVPDWLKLYGEASPQSDHLLNWNLFKLNQLQQFDLMLRKLYKQEVLNTVSKFERARAEINGELLRRFQRS